MRAINPLQPYSVSNLFDAMFDDRVFDDKQGFPKYNIVKDENIYTIELALAGYKPEDIEILHNEDNNVLTIKTNQNLKSNISDRKFVVNGITNRSFTKTFTLAKEVNIKSATFENGMLSIILERVVIEPKVVPIKISGGASEKQLIQG